METEVAKSAKKKENMRRFASGSLTFLFFSYILEVCRRII